MLKWFLIFIIALTIQVNGQDREYGQTRKSFKSYYFSPLKISRDHPLHASFFQIPLLSAQSLDSDTGVIGGSFEYSSIEGDYKNDTFSYDLEGGLFRLNFDLFFSLREDLDFLIRYDISGVDGDRLLVMDKVNVLKNDLKKSGSGNIDVIAKQKVYSFDNDIDLGVVIACSIPIVNTKTFSNSKKFDFGGGLLATYKSELFALHLNLGLVYLKESTAFSSDTEFNISAYGGFSAVGQIVNDWYGVAQISIQNPAMKTALSPGNVLGDVNVGVRYVYNSYISELWVGEGIGQASHGINIGFSFSVSY
jgi:hypothetical protein